MNYVLTISADKKLFPCAFLFNETIAMAIYIN